MMRPKPDHPWIRLQGRMRRLWQRWRRWAAPPHPLPTLTNDPATSPSLRLLVDPPVADQRDLTDLAWRLAWYLAPLRPWLQTISIPTQGRLPIGDRPADLAADIADPRSALTGCLERFDVTAGTDAWAQAMAACQLVLQRGPHDPTTPARAHRHWSRRRRWAVDPERDRGESSHYLWGVHDVLPDRPARIRSFQARWQAFREQQATDRVAVFGTGPSLSATVASRTWDDHLCIACNSLVTNQALLERLRPRVIAAADPIFHAGCSAYAGAFRAALVTALDRYDALLVVPMRDAAHYAMVLGPARERRLVAVPFTTDAMPTLGLDHRFAVTVTANVLTLFLLPLAAALGRQVTIAGCDGRAPTDGQTFWRHDPVAQLTDHLAGIRRVHPGFFAIDYDDYYHHHCQDLASALQRLEATGHGCTYLGPTHIECLAARRAPVAADVTGDD